MKIFCLEKMNLVLKVEFLILKVIAEKHQEEYNMDYLYNWPSIAIDFNKLDEELVLKICPSDCRLRPDQKALEFRNVQLATSEKHRLEVNQRKRRKHREENELVHKPVWFEKYFDEDSQEEVWGYIGGYWETRFYYYEKNCTLLGIKKPDIGK